MNLETVHEFYRDWDQGPFDLDHNLDTWRVVETRVQADWFDGTLRFLHLVVKVA